MNKNDEWEVLLGKVIVGWFKKYAEPVLMILLIGTFFSIMYMGATYNWGGQ